VGVIVLAFAYVKAGFNKIKKSIIFEAQTSDSQYLISRHMNTHFMNVLLLFLLINYYWTSYLCRLRT